MIDEEATFEWFGYHSTDWAPKSRKKVVTVCDDCGTMRIVKKKHYRARCRSCAKKGRNHPNWKGGNIKQVCQICGAIRYYKPCDIERGRGRFCSRKCMGKWFSKHIRGEKTSNWKGGTSFEPYCAKFNDEFKEYIRDKFGRICFLCGKTEEDNDRKLDVHHVNGTKRVVVMAIRHVNLCRYVGFATTKCILRK